MCSSWRKVPDCPRKAHAPAPSSTCQAPGTAQRDSFFARPEYSLCLLAGWLAGWRESTDIFVVDASLGTSSRSLLNSPPASSAWPPSRAASSKPYASVCLRDPDYITTTSSMQQRTAVITGIRLAMSFQPIQLQRPPSVWPAEPIGLAGFKNLG